MGAFGLLGAIAALALAVCAAPASAQRIHVLQQTIFPTEATRLNNPRAIAVDSSSGTSAGDFYVADSGNHRIIKFDASGNFLLMWGRSVNEGTGNPDICTNGGPPENVCKETGVTGTGAGWVSNPNAIVVDSSSSPSAGDIYVADSNYVQKFDPTGHLITSWGGAPFAGAINGSTAPAGTFPNAPGPMVVDASGRLGVWRSNNSTLYRFADDGSSPESFLANTRTSNNTGFAVDPGNNYYKGNSNDGTIEKFGPNGEDVGAVTTGNAVYRGFFYDGTTNDLFGYYTQTQAISVYHFNGSGEVVQENGSTCTPAPNAGCQPIESFGKGTFGTGGGPQGLSGNTTTGQIYVLNTGALNILKFAALNLPKVTTETPESVERDRALLKAHVDPDGEGEVLSCEFEFGKTTTYGESAPCTPGSTSTAVDVSSQLPAGTLEAATLYHFRVLAENANGTIYGEDKTFTTLPSVSATTTKPATNVARVSATLNGSFTGDGVDTTYYFEYGLDSEYGSKTAPVDQGTASGTQEVSTNIASLYAYYAYHYRLVAENKYGTTYGADEILETLAPDPPTVESTYAGAVDAETAVVDAQIDTGDGLTSFRFEYGTTTEYGQRTPVDGPIEPESPDQTASADLDELSPGTIYHFRVVASNIAGTTVGPDQTFTTLSAPLIGTEASSGVTSDAAVLSATIGSGLSSTSYRFEYGPTTAYGAQVPGTGSVGPDSALHQVSTAVGGLIPGTTYHFRAVATNAVGTTFGVDQTFTTLPALQATVLPETRTGGGKKCKKGFVKKHGKCVRKKKKKRRHQRNVAGRKHG